MKKVLAAGIALPFAVMLLSAGSVFAATISSSNTTTNSASVSVSNSNSATVVNNVTTNASTGGNTASGGNSATVNTSSNGSRTSGGTVTNANANQGGAIQTGDAVAESNVTNALNANVTFANAPSLPDNSADANANNSADSFNTNDSHGWGHFQFPNISITNRDTNTSRVNVSNSNDAAVENNVATRAATGNNTASGGNSIDANFSHSAPSHCNCTTGSGTDVTNENSNLGGEVVTGSSFSSSSVANYLNFNVTSIQ